MGQKLDIYQSLWAMELRQPGVSEHSAEENFSMISEAGYTGVCVDPSVEEIQETLALKPLFEKYGLKCMVNAFPAELDELPPLLQLANKLQATQVNVIGGVMPLTVEEAVPVIHQWISDGEKAGIPLLFETHRDCTLNDLYFTLQLMEAVPELRLCADLSHYVIDRELRLPLDDRHGDYIHRILERSDCFQGRVANREQVQVQIDFPQHQQWVQTFRGWWKDGIGMWRRRNADDATLIFLCELGPPPYAITDANGAELSDRWSEALAIRSWVEEIWRSLS